MFDGFVEITGVSSGFENRCVTDTDEEKEEERGEEEEEEEEGKIEKERAEETVASFR